MNLFAYGTLMFPAIWLRIVGREFLAQPASVAGFAVYRVAGGVYPVMIAAEPSSRVEGLVFRDVDAVMLRRLDEYESDLYERTEVQAVLAGGQEIACVAYVLPEHNRSHASDEVWSAEAFARDHLAGYLVRLR
jgi:gamma-glutamylcyclotransferase (GGCT)/AIG2-like uncharacterized protein YtfP